MGLTCQRGGGTFFSRNTEALPTYSARTVRNKEELSLRATMDLVGPSRQALHVQSSSDDSRMLTTPRRAHRGGGRRRGPRRERPGDGEDAAVESQTERSWKIDWFGCGVGLHSIENNRRCGVERWPGRRRGSVSLRCAKQRRWTPKARAGGSGSAGGRIREIEEECRPLDVNPTPCLGFDLCIFIFCKSA